MKKYEVIREVFSQCSANTKAIPYLSEEIIDDLDTYMGNVIAKDSICEKVESTSEAITYEVQTTTAGRVFKERYTFSEI